MKRFIVILVMILMLTSCTNDKGLANIEPEANQLQQNNTTPTEKNNSDIQTNIDDSYYGQYQMSDEGFSEHVKDNAIDKEYKEELAKFQESSEFSTQGWVELEDKYYEIWDKELNNTYNILLKKLNEKEQNKLKEAQKGWLQYHTNESDFIRETWEDFGFGSQARVQLVISANNRLRVRTLQLMEYNFMLGGDVEFLYKGTNK